MLKHPRVPTPGSVLAGVGVVTLAIAPQLALQSAQAHTARAPGPPSAIAAAERAVVIGSSLGAAGAGSYYDPDNHKLVVNVTTEEAAGKAREAGAEARIVKHSLASLDAARATLKEHASIPGTSWAMDPKINKVVVTADRTVRGDDLERLKAVAGSLGDRVVVQLSPDTLEPLIAGGDAIWGTEARCSLGFNVTKGGQPYFLTAGHCTHAVPSWSVAQEGPPIAMSEAGSFPGDDFGIARYTAADMAHPSEVDLFGGAQHIVRAADPIVGQKVRRSGSTSHVHDGEVTALNVTANYQEGVVEGLIQTSVCAEAGDSGGPLFEGDSALGLTSGGRGTCAAGGVSLYQPVTEALQKTGARIG
ncbi:S1 family peptidase [Streptomyces sp. DSM 41528]|uniref:S1 family peptidase n=1 Tax=Streptomyces bugieae TaxID=3098223 RepID=A0ABU7NHV2_9ACTN|nr:S1 family peptidase [Streptomyces sp. DSM 41528]